MVEGAQGKNVILLRNSSYGEQNLSNSASYNILTASILLSIDEDNFFEKDLGLSKKLYKSCVLLRGFYLPFAKQSLYFSSHSTIANLKGTKHFEIASRERVFSEIS